MEQLPIQNSQNQRLRGNINREIMLFRAEKKSSFKITYFRTIFEEKLLNLKKLKS